MSNAQHTSGAMAAAKVIARQIRLQYGSILPDTADGIAGIIDQHTAAPELLEGHLSAVHNITKALELGDKGDWKNAEIFLNNQRGISEEAIAKPQENKTPALSRRGFSVRP